MANILKFYRGFLVLLNYYPKFKLGKERVNCRLTTIFIAANVIHLISILFLLVEKLGVFERYAALRTISGSELALEKLQACVDFASATIIRAVAVLTAKNAASFFHLFEGGLPVQGKLPHESTGISKVVVIVVVFLMAVTGNHSYAVIKALMERAWNSEGYNGTYVQTNPVVWAPVHILGSLADHTAVPLALSFIVVFGFMFVSSYSDQGAEWGRLLPCEVNRRHDCVPSYCSIRELCLGFKVLKSTFKIFRSVSEAFSFCLIIKCALACLRIMGHLTSYESIRDIDPTVYQFGFLNTFCVVFLAYAGNVMHTEVKSMNSQKMCRKIKY